MYAYCVVNIILWRSACKEDAGGVERPRVFCYKMFVSASRTTFVIASVVDKRTILWIFNYRHYTVSDVRYHSSKFTPRKWTTGWKVPLQRKHGSSKIEFIHQQNLHQGQRNSSNANLKRQYRSCRMIYLSPQIGLSLTDIRAIFLTSKRFFEICK